MWSTTIRFGQGKGACYSTERDVGLEGCCCYARSRHAFRRCRLGNEPIHTHHAVADLNQSEARNVAIFSADGVGGESQTTARYTMTQCGFVVFSSIALKPVLKWANICSPNIPFWTVRRTMIRFLKNGHWQCCSGDDCGDECEMSISWCFFSINDNFSCVKTEL